LASEGSSCPSVDSAVIAPLGVIAGQGDLPLLICQAARGCGHQTVGFGVSGFASEKLAECVDRMYWLELGQLGRLIELMHENGVRSVIMAGRVPHTSVLQYRHFDWRAVKMLGRTLNKKADSLLGAITRELESENLRVLDSTLFLKSMMPEAGLLTAGRPLTAEAEEDVRFGFPIAKAIGGLDIGQTIVVRDKMVVAVEGAEGTDECIRRAGALAGPGCVVVKVSKPRQDMRFDVPVVGLRTIQVMCEAGCAALAISARECLFLDREAVLAEAHEANIAIVALENPENE
jgi:UDP-2,3-diacylglucosamine hydrolase